MPSDERLRRATRRSGRPAPSGGALRRAVSAPTSHPILLIFCDRLRMPQTPAAPAAIRPFRDRFSFQIRHSSSYCSARPSSASASRWAFKQLHGVASSNSRSIGRRKVRRTSSTGASSSGRRTTALAAPSSPVVIGDAPWRRTSCTSSWSQSRERPAATPATGVRTRESRTTIFSHSTTRDDAARVASSWRAATPEGK